MNSENGLDLAGLEGKRRESMPSTLSQAQQALKFSPACLFRDM